MKHWGLFLFALAFAACHDDNQPEPQPDYYITPEEDEIETDCNGVKQRIAVSSNCDWHPGAVPEWCVVQKITADGKEYLDVEVLPNTEETSRDTTIPLLYGRRIATATLTVTQSGKEPVDRLKWSLFSIYPVLYNPDATYEVLEDNITRRYQISGKAVFTNPSWRKQIFPGNAISCRSDMLTLTDYQDKFTFNPITLCTAAAVGSELAFRDLPEPSYEKFNEWIREITVALPKEGLGLIYNNIPTQYYSYRHLHLLGVGNLGLKLDELISGKPYTEKEMAKSTGLIYDFTYNWFSTIMDFPDKPINETISDEDRRDLRFINNVYFGITALLLVETNYGYTEANRVTRKIMKGEELNGEETKIGNDLTAYYIYFDKSGTLRTETGGRILIGKYFHDITTLEGGIVPLCFTTFTASGNEGQMEVTFDLL